MKKLLLIIVALFILSTLETNAKGLPFAPKANTYKKSNYKKHRSYKKDAFVCVRHKKVNRKGLLK